MIEATNRIYSEIKDFILFTAGKELNIYNASTMTIAPKKPNRIEFKLDSFRSLGFNKRNKIDTLNKFELGVEATYDCVLEIRVIDSPLSSMDKMTRIAGGLNHSELRNQFMRYISIKPATMRQMQYEVKQDGTLYRVERLIVDATVALAHNYEFDWFNKIENVKLIIDGKEEEIN